MDEKLYSIKESTLVDIGDALRRKHGETKMGTVIEDVLVPDVVVSKTPNATGFFTFNDSTKEPIKAVYPITILGASSIKVRFTYNISTANYCMKIASGFYESNSLFPTSVKSYDGNSTEIVELIFANTQSITIYLFVSGVKGQGYYAEITGLDENGNPINGKTIQVEKEVEVPNTYSSAEVAQAIDDIKAGADIPEEAFVVTGNCGYRFANNGWNWFIDTYGDRITTKDISDATNMFYFCDLKNIPFDINFKNPSSLEYMFHNCRNMKTFPKLTIASDLTSHIKFSNMFSNCENMREVPEGLAEIMKADYELNKANTTFAPWNSMFISCSSLREIPSDVIKYMYNPTQNGNYYGLAYCKPFAYCYSLNKLENIIPDNYELTSNQWNGWFSNSYRLKDFTFATNEDGTPFVRKWKSQTLELYCSSSIALGVSGASKYILDYNSGITADKEVKDDATYAALKDDPDWFTTKAEYSRYNHDSAVATINSLPDTSAYLAEKGGTNTIKFKGAAGSKTDGGAINTLTAEEIAVATAKGWTISFA